MNETGKPSLKHYKNKNVFQKTVNSNFGGFRRKVAVEDEVNNRSQEFSIDEESNSPNRQKFVEIVSSTDGEEIFSITRKQGSKTTKVVHLNANVDQIGRRTQQRLMTKESNSTER